MKRILPLVLLLVCATFVQAQNPVVVTLRHHQDGTSLRIVVESEEEMIRNLNAAASPSSIRVDFPSPFVLQKKPDFIFTATASGRSLLIAPKQVAEVRTYKLFGPPRLVLEMKLAQAPQDAASMNNAPQQKTDAAPPPAGDAAQTKTLKTISIVLDAGHGGYDSGLVRESAKEKDIALNFTKELSAALNKKGLKTLMTRKSDQAISLAERINFGNSRRPDLLLGIHLSTTDKFVIYTAAIDDRDVDPTIRLYQASVRQARHLEKSRALAKSIGESLRKECKTDVLYRELPAPLLTALDAPSLIVELPMKPDHADQKVRVRTIDALIKGLPAHE